MKVLITGAQGFIAKNLKVRLLELKDFEILEFTRTSHPDSLDLALAQADAVVHLAGTNRPTDLSEFKTGNTDFTQKLCELIKSYSNIKKVLFTSSRQAELDNPYGISKKLAEDFVLGLKDQCKVGVYRLPNVFGKWSRPNYNSAVATFCYNIARDLPIRVDDPNKELSLVYIDDVITHFIQFLNGEGQVPTDGFMQVSPVYNTQVGYVAQQIQSYHDLRSKAKVLTIGQGLERALYATYISFLPKEHFAYALQGHSDSRGTFCEVLKTPASGQVSFFTAHPGVTRGGHYHHTKSEIFLVVQGRALFKFKHLTTHEYFELEVDAKDLRCVQTIPGWAHDITNISDQEMIVVLWANEIFDKSHPDTIAAEVRP